MLTRLKSFAIECQRVLRITKKPDNTEFINIVKISALGILLIGAIGFLLQLIRTLLF